jgi:predicted dehydrogenase
MPRVGSRLTRRRFLSSSLSAGAAWSLLPARLSGQASARPAPPDRPLRLAVIGIGNRGADMIKTFAATGRVTFTAFCDVDLEGAHTAEARALHPEVPRFGDFRSMFEAAGDSIDAAVVCTPDHAHFPAAMHAMARGKHVYVEKPLAQSFREVDLLMAMADRTGVVTQMGNQGHSGNNYFQFEAWTRAGLIKDVTRIDAFMSLPRRWHGWTMDGYPCGEPIPADLNWNEWLAARPARPYSAKLHPLAWRGWFDFGTGAFGDWGAHILDTAHRFLDLGLPHTIEAVHREGVNPFVFPQASTIRFEFAARGAMPPVEVIWRDGIGNTPPLPPQLGPDATLTEEAGKFIYARDLVFKGGTHGDTLRIVPETRMHEMAATLPRIASGHSDHATNFVRACQGREESRSPFRVAGPLTQVFLLGIVAQRLGGRLTFDAASRGFVGNQAANDLLAGPPPRPGWGAFYPSGGR